MLMGEIVHQSDSLTDGPSLLPSAHGARVWTAQTGIVFRLAYLSLIGAVVSMPVHFLAGIHHSQWAVLGLMVLAAGFLTAGLLRRP